jgi:hypothetical protein
VLIDPSDLVWALRTVRREARDRGAPPVWSDADWTDALNETAFGDPLHPFYDPYLAAISFLLDPSGLNSRRLIDVTETFIDQQKLADHLKDLSQRHRALFGGAIGPVFSAWGP